MRRIAGLALSAVGLIALIAGIVTGIVAKQDSHKSASVSPDASGYVYTTSGVLDLVDSIVTVTATGEADADVTVAYGAPVDVEAWVQGLSATKVTGLSSWTELAAETVKGDTTDTKLADSDMWITTKTAKGSVSQQYDVATHGTVSVIATTSTGKAPKLTLSWDAPNRTNVVPVVIIGLLLLLIGAALVALDVQDRRQDRDRAELRQRAKHRREQRSEATTDVLSIEDIASAPRGTVVAATAGTLGAGILASSPHAERLRNRALSDDERIILAEPEEEGVTPSEAAAPAEGADAAVDNAAVTADAATTASEPEAERAPEQDAGSEHVTEALAESDPMAPDSDESADAAGVADDQADVEADEATHADDQADVEADEATRADDHVVVNTDEQVETATEDGTEQAAAVIDQPAAGDTADDAATENGVDSTASEDGSAAATWRNRWRFAYGENAEEN